MIYKLCNRCKAKFQPSVWNQVYCGSKTFKTGCSWWNVNEHRSQRRWQDEHYREYQKNYGSIWKKQQRKNNTDYALRQLESKRTYSQTENGKQIAREWRKQNLRKILFWNKQRKLAARQVEGKFTWQQWEELKNKYNYQCANCGISEKELRKRWRGTNFTKLTIDHIKPIVLGGMNYIFNIQPLCISCNAKKHAKA